MIKHCKTCGKNIETKGHLLYCESCKPVYKRHNNALCDVCGTPFYSHGKEVCCSLECGKLRKNKIHGWKTIESVCSDLNCDESGVVSYIDNLHNKEMRTMVYISEKLGVPRITIMRWCKKHGIKTRSISEDNKRRFSLMSQEDKNKMAFNAQEKCRELFRNPEWKSAQMKKLLEAQNFMISRPEKAMLSALNDIGYLPVQQYQLGAFFIDLAFPEIKLAIEIDGEYWHSLPKTISRDKRKNYFVRKKCGWHLIRFPASKVYKDPTGYAWNIAQAYETLKITD